MIGQNFDPNLAKTFLVRFENEKHMKDWIFSFLGLDLPDNHIDPDSNSSPIGWMFEVYKMYEENRCNESPSVITVSARESYKTMTESILAIILMVHFKATICHMAAIVSQATAAAKYVSSFLQKISPYVAHHGYSVTAQNSKEVSIATPTGEQTWMKIVVCSITGANSSHSNILCLDEVDTIRSAEGIRAYKEAAFIPGVFNGQHPVTIKTSTLKFPGGLFMKEMKQAALEKWKTYRWNILDVTEYCPPERHLPDGPKEIRYIAKGLPLKTINQDEYDFLADKERDRFDRIEAKAGCAKCPLLPVCKGRLSERSPEDKGGLWKPIDFTISQFKKTDPDLAESQLMCWRPSSQGMVYPRFTDVADGTGNTYTISQAWERFTGTLAPRNITLRLLSDNMLSKGVKFQCGVDWGYAHAFSIVVTAVLPSKEWWIIDTYAVPGLEFDQMLSLAKQVRDTYRPVKWFCDTAEPMFIKTFRKNRMPAPDFKKDVRGGIEAVRGQIVNASDYRHLKVIKHDRNDMMLRVFAEHTFKLDSNGNLTDEPDDSDVADPADALRYAAQNLFQPKGRIHSPNSPMDVQGNSLQDNGLPKREYQDWISQKARELTQGQGFEAKGKSESGTTYWDFGDPADDQ